MKRDRTAPVRIEGQLPRREHISLELLQVWQEVLAGHLGELEGGFQTLLQENRLNLPSFEPLIDLMAQCSENREIFRRDAGRVIQHQVIPPLRELLRRLQELSDQNISLSDQLNTLVEASWHTSPESEQSHVGQIVEHIRGLWQKIGETERRYLEIKDQINRAYRNRSSLYEFIAGNREAGYQGAFDRYSEILTQYEESKQEFQEVKARLTRPLTDEGTSDDEAELWEFKQALFECYSAAEATFHQLRIHLQKADRDLAALQKLDDEINSQLILEARQLLTALTLYHAEIERSLPPPLRSVCLQTAAIDEGRLAQVKEYSVGELYQSAPSPPGLPEVGSYLERQVKILKEMEVDTYLLCDIDPLPRLHEQADQLLLRQGFACLDAVQKSRSSPGRQPSRIAEALSEARCLTRGTEETQARLTELLENAGRTVERREARGFGSEPYYKLTALGLELIRRWQTSENPPLTDEAILAIRQFFGETK